MTARPSAPTLTDRDVAPGRLVVGGLNFEVQLSGVRRSIGITVDRDGSLIVNAPRDCGEVELAAFAHEKRMWVYKKLAEKDLLLSHRPTKDFVSGEGFTYLGRSHRLLVADRHPDAVKLERGLLVMRRDVAMSHEGADAMIDWYPRERSGGFRSGWSHGLDGSELRQGRSTCGTWATDGALLADTTACTFTGRRSSSRRCLWTT